MKMRNGGNTCSFILNHILIVQMYAWGKGRGGGGEGEGRGRSKRRGGRGGGSGEEGRRERRWKKRRGKRRRRTKKRAESYGEHSSQVHGLRTFLGNLTSTLRPLITCFMPCTFF